MCVSSPESDFAERRRLVNAVLDAFRAHAWSLHERLSTRYAQARERHRISHDLERERIARVRRWRKRLKSAGVWEDRLAALNIAEVTFVDVGLADGIRDVGEGVRSCVADLFSNAERGSAEHARSYSTGLPPLPPILEATVDEALSTAVGTSGVRLDRRCADLAHLLTVEGNFVLSELHELLLPSIVAELHAESRDGGLQGDTPKARYEFFCENRLPTAAWLSSYLQRYPIALRQIEQIVRSRCSGFVDLLKRFDRDYSLLAARRFLDGRCEPKLVSLSPALGDRHRGGVAVRALTLEDGRRVIYKPRNVAIDIAFQDLVQWMNDKGFNPSLYIMPIIARKGYGWFQYVEPKDCDNTAAVARFYTRHGAHMALLYLLGGHDFFHSNVRATGEYPVLVDLECAHALQYPPLNGEFVRSPAETYLSESVFRTGMLPSWSWIFMGRRGVDLSSLTLTDGQEAPRDVIEWKSRGTDRLRQYRTRRMLVSDDANLTSLAGVPVPVDDFERSLFSGFEDAYRIIGDHKDELLAPGSVLGAFASLESRLVLRSTINYQALLRELRHPTYLCDGMGFSEFLDRHWVSLCPRYPAGVIESEINQMWSGDVPLFTTRGNSRDLYDGEGSIIVKNYVEETASAGARRRLERWGPADRERQFEIMQCAFSITRLVHVQDRMMPEKGQSSGGRIEPQLFFEEAVNLGEQLLEAGIEDEHSLSWIGVSPNRSGQMDQASLDTGLYQGGTGIALFLLMAGELVGRRSFIEAADKIIANSCVEACRKVLANRSKLDNWILYQPEGMEFPLCGLYLAMQASSLGRLTDSDVNVIFDASMACASAGFNRQPRFDFLNGGAGVIRVLLMAYRKMGNPRALHLARRYGDQLLQNATPAGAGLGWRSDYYATPLGGFAHGATGIVWVLAELAEATSDQRYLDAALGGLRFDRGLFSTDRDEWYDLRFSGSEPGEAVQWCHGTPGIALGRALMWRVTRDDPVARDAERAVSLTLQSDVVNDGLCHGSLGNVDCCMVAAEIMGRDDWREAAYQKAAGVWWRARDRGFWITGSPGRNIGLHGLFMGKAGIGYALLRLACPALLPSVLFLESPRTERGSVNPVGNFGLDR